MTQQDTQSAKASGATVPAPAPLPAEPVGRRFAGKVALVTGAARGQGRAEAVRLAAEGADVIAVDICADLPGTVYPGATPGDLRETVRMVERLDRRILAHQADVRDYEALAGIVRDGVAELGRLDVVVANAGMTTAALTWETGLDEWRESLDHNLTGAFVTAKATVPVMLAQGYGGAIVFISSVSGLRGLPYLGAYSAAKHGLVGLARVLANELAPYRIRVNTVHPWGVDTDLRVTNLFTALQDNPDYQKVYSTVWPDRVSEPEDIAAAVAWLASDEARHVTGIQLPVDRGRTNQ
jgi:SDR family mycofactocin-dependent oxidoreductase